MSRYDDICSWHPDSTFIYLYIVPSLTIFVPKLMILRLMKPINLRIRFSIFFPFDSTGQHGFQEDVQLDDPRRPSQRLHRHPRHDRLDHHVQEVVKLIKGSCTVSTGWSLC